VDAPYDANRRIAEALLVPAWLLNGLVGVFASVIDSSRRVGAFYVLAAIVWIGVSVAVTLS
jgi:hypothetical protein